MQRYILGLIMGGIAVAASAGTYVVMSDKPASAPSHIGASNTTESISPVDGSDSDDKLANLELVPLIAVDDPFGGDGSPGMLLLTSSTEFPDLISVIEYPIDDTDLITLDTDISSMDIGESDITSQAGQMIFKKVLNFNQTAPIAWEQPVGESSFHWNTSPDRLLIPAGSQVIVSYTYELSNGQWTGDVSVSKPSV